MFNWLTRKNTHIYSSGPSFTTTEFGVLDIESEGDKVTLRHVVRHRGKELARAVLTVYDKSDLEHFPAYMTPEQKTELKFLNTWHILDSKTADKNIRLVYSDQSDLGFVSVMGPGFEFKFIDAFILSNHAFFKELDTFNCLEASGLSRNSIHTTLSREHLAVLVEDHFAINQLIRAGITGEQMATMSVERLALLLKKSSKLSHASNFLSINQLIGLDHTPKPVPDKIDWPKRVNDFSTMHAYHDNTESYHSKNYHEISYEKDGRTYKASYREQIVDEAKKAELDKLFKGRKIKNNLLNHWHIGKLPDNSVTLFYAPSISWLSSINESPGFTLEEAFERDPTQDFLIYRERKFMLALREQGVRIDELLQKPGFTSSKINLLCLNFETVQAFEKNGMKFEDYESVDEQRLAYVFEHFYKAQAALEFVDVFELFALRSTSPLLNAYRARRGMEVMESIEPVMNSNNNSCAMM